MRPLRFSDHQEARGVAVQSMDNPRSLHPTDAGQCPAVGEQGMHQRAGASSGARMDDHSRSFIQDDEVLVLMQDVERDRLWCEQEWPSRRDVELDVLAGSHPMARLLRVAADQDVPALDEPLDPRSRQAARPGQEHVQALLRLGLGHDKLPQVHLLLSPFAIPIQEHVQDHQAHPDGDG